MKDNKNFIFELVYDTYCVALKKYDKSEITNEIRTFEINETINRFKDMISSEEELREYLDTRISRERNEEDIKIIYGEEAQNSNWWTKYKNTNTGKLQYWNRYKSYLTREKKWEKSAITKSIDNPTDVLLNSICDPLGNFPQEKKAMVVGYVQSGKTANYIGLINKAIDAGYKYIIVLAGMHNNLRSQTQARIDEEVLGYDTDSIAKKKQRENSERNIIGVGKISDADIVQTLTNRDDDGDFKKNRLNVVTSPDIPMIVVTKKTKPTLENLIKYIKDSSLSIPDQVSGSKKMLAKYPLLLIDDEADQASVNTAYKYDGEFNIKDETEVKTINKLIRNLFNLFERRSYVGYTATPYANIFIPNNLKDVPMDLGNDLFPSDCIISLPKPYKYIGANEFFGYGEDDEENPMPLVRHITEPSFVDSKNKFVGDVPESMHRAMISFVISVAIRNLRGDKYKPKTMLIHIDRRIELQNKIERKVSSYFCDELQNMIINGDIEVEKQIKDIIKNDYLTTTAEMKNNFSRYMDDSDFYEVDDVYKEIVRLMNENKIKVKVINGESSDYLEYKNNSGKEYNVIAIGGDKFSRGLTLEGLSVSYFTRESKYYDTLMQMGRWFGFRPRYADLCRVYIPSDLYKWFARIAFANDNLRNQIAYMSDLNAKPSEFGLQVISHPDLKISNPQKIKSGAPRIINFSNNLTTTRDIDVDKDIYEINYNAVNKLFSEAKHIYTSEEHFSRLCRSKIANHYFLENVSGKRIAEFFKEYKTSQHAFKINGVNIATYIEEQINDENGDYLNDWTVGLINTGTPNRIKIADLMIGGGIVKKSENSLQLFDDKTPKVCSIRALKSQEQEYMGLTKKEYDDAMRLYQELKEKDETNIATKIRATFNPNKGLLLIYPIDFEQEQYYTSCFKIGDGNHKHPFGLVIVFPRGNGHSVSYVLNQIAYKKGENEYDLFD